MAAVGAALLAGDSLLQAGRRPLLIFALDAIDELEADLGRADSQPKLEAFHDRLAELTFFDPACGCGNFLDDGQSAIACPRFSHVGFFCDLKGIINLDAETANGAGDVGMCEQELGWRKIASAPIDQLGLRSTERMRTELRWTDPSA